VTLLLQSFADSAGAIGSILAPINTVALCVMAFRAGRVVERVKDQDKRLDKIEVKCLGVPAGRCLESD